MRPHSLNLERSSVDSAIEANRSFVIAGVELSIASDDALLLDEFASVFGETEGRTAPRARLHARVASNASSTYGQIEVTGDDLEDAASFLLGFKSPTIPMVPLASRDPDEKLIGLEREAEPLFVFRRNEGMMFRKVDRWRRIVSHVLFLRLLNMRRDLVFFHAASVAMQGKGILLVGPKGSGKSTLSLALAVRGHSFLGDEMAVYEPQTGRLLPMLRPVGIKPGIRSRAIEAAMARLGSEADPEGMFRIPIRQLLPATSAAAAPLGAIVFLHGFGPEPRMTRATAGRNELALMQPVHSSTIAGTNTTRVFEMIRLLGSVDCYHLIAADADQTAHDVEEVLTHDHASE